ncbi:MAG: hypothetical protein J4G09_01955 [Proteobacteria bacterium]|nr:hypothetical protein [Pseudomonadota bacterium]
MIAASNSDRTEIRNLLHRAFGEGRDALTAPESRLLGEVVQDARQRGIDKPIVCSLAGDVEVEQACAGLNEFDILAYPYATQKPIAVLDAKYRGARGAGLVQMAQD